MQHRASVHYRIQLGASQDIHDWQGKYLLELEALCLMMLLLMQLFS
jgi:hypothetical protein